MIAFWILAALLLLAGYAFFLPALLGHRRPSAVDRQKLNLILHSQRREELTREATGVELEDLTNELDQDLFADLAATDTPTPTEPGKGRWSAGLALLLVPVLAVVIYQQLGRPDLVDFQGAAQIAEDDGSNPMPADFQATIDKLAERLKRDPNDLNGWLLLARSLMATDQVDKALTAYEFALKLAPNNPDIRALYAEALAEGNDGRFEGKPVEILTDILNKDPKHPTALWLAGLAAARSGDGATAVARWEALKAQFPPDSEDARQLAQYITRAKGEPAQTVTVNEAAAQSSPDGAKKAIQVKVSLAEELKSKAAPGDTVFIFARAASGPPMPLAIVRKQVKDLPVEVTLDDSMSMMDGMTLASFEKLILGARVSKTGQAMPQPGDLQGLSEPTAVQDGHTYSVRIAREMR